jgi:FdhD protein
METRSKLFQTTGGVHSACLADRKKILLFTEDIGRQNALDKIIGASLLKNISLQNKIMLSSGRITSETITKMVRAMIPVIVSPGAPTDSAVNLARRLGITVVGFARGKRINIYSHPERII